MSTPKHKIFFGVVEGPQDPNNIPDDPNDPGEIPEIAIGWTWDTTEKIFSSEIRTFDEGYSVQQLINQL